MIKYKVTEQNFDNPNKSILESTQTEVKHKFSLQEVIDNDNASYKMKKENEANLKIVKAKVKNIEDHHSFVTEFSDEQLFTLHMYVEEKAKVKGFTDEVEKADEFIETYKTIKKEITEQTKTKFPKVKF